MESVKKGQFIAAAMQELVPRGFNIIGPTVQADVESGCFRKVIGWNNFWGIKASKRWPGKRVECLTTEYYRDPDKLARFINANAQKIEKAWWEKRKERWGFKVLADFRDWHREPEAMKWYAGLVSRMYPKAWAHRGDKDPRRFFNGLVSGKWQWATDDEYVGILIDRWERYYKGREL